MNVTIKEAKKIEPGLHQAVYIRYETLSYKSKFSNTDETAIKHIFDVNGVELSYLTPSEPTTLNKFGRLLAIFGYRKNDAVDMDALKGRQCKVLVALDAKGFSTIKDLVQ